MMDQANLQKSPDTCRIVNKKKTAETFQKIGIGTKLQPHFLDAILDTQPFSHKKTRQSLSIVRECLQEERFAGRFNNSSHNHAYHINYTRLSYFN